MTHTILIIESVSVEQLKNNSFIKCAGFVTARFKVYHQDTILNSATLESESRATNVLDAQKLAIQNFANAEFQVRDSLMTIQEIKSYKINHIDIQIADGNFKELFEKLLGMKSWNESRIGDYNREDDNHFTMHCPFH